MNEKEVDKEDEKEENLNKLQKSEELWIQSLE
jgi:hypothetical protein